MSVTVQRPARSGDQTGVCPVKKIKEITAFIPKESLKVNLAYDKVIVQGIVHKQVYFVGADDIVHHEPEDVPFSHMLEIPGTTPGMEAVVGVEVEYLIYHLSPDHTRLIQKIVLIVQAKVYTAEGQLVGEARQQVLVENVKEFVCVVKRPILVGAVFAVKEQVLLVRDIPLEAIKVKNVDAVVRDVTVKLVDGTAIVSGVVHKQVYYVTPDNLVQMITEDIPFSHSMALPSPAPGATVEVQVNVEFLIPELLRERQILRQKVVLLVELVAIIPDEVVEVVVDVSGPGIQVDKVAIRQPSGIVEVVTDVRGPGVISVVKRTVYVDVVGDGTDRLVPLQVVTDVVLATSVLA